MVGPVPLRIMLRQSHDMSRSQSEYAQLAEVLPCQGKLPERVMGCRRASVVITTSVPQIAAAKSGDARYLPAPLDEVGPPNVMWVKASVVRSPVAAGSWRLRMRPRGRLRPEASLVRRLPSQKKS